MKMRAHCKQNMLINRQRDPPSPLHFGFKSWLPSQEGWENLSKGLNFSHFFFEIQKSTATPITDNTGNKPLNNERTSSTSYQVPVRIANQHKQHQHGSRSLYVHHRNIFRWWQWQWNFRNHCISLGSFSTFGICKSSSQVHNEQCRIHPCKSREAMQQSSNLTLSSYISQIL